MTGDRACPTPQTSFGDTCLDFVVSDYHLAQVSAAVIHEAEIAAALESERYILSEWDDHLFFPIFVERRLTLFP